MAAAKMDWKRMIVVRLWFYRYGKGRKGGNQKNPVAKAYRYAYLVKLDLVEQMRLWQLL
jgi:hypothetical protein